MKKVLLAVLMISALPAAAQVLDPQGLGTYFNEGVHLEYKPIHFKTRFRFRMQNRFTYETQDTEDLSAKVADFNVRRMRLRLDGTVWDPRLLYRIQLSFTRGDMDYDRTQYPNILRDAVVGWRLTDTATIWYGQTKLPGNRQRVTSSGSQQLVDRSIVNATFTLDRDMGAQFYQRWGEDRPFWLKLAVSNGEGRATDNKDNGLSYTGRVEWLPLGAFKDEGDYFEGDLARELTPKLSIGAVFNANKKTTRPGGQLGTQYTTPGLNRDLQTWFLDAIFKHRGFSWSSEYANRWAHDPVFMDGAKEVTVFKGQGITTQAGFLFDNNIEPSVRYSQLFADKESQAGSANNQKEYTLGLSKYFNRHTVKVQTDLSYDELSNSVKDTYRSYWVYRLQLEIGI